MKMSMDVAGLKELDDLLRQLGPATARKVAVTALRNGAKVIQSAARQLAPVGPEHFTLTKDYGGDKTRKSKYGSLRQAIVIKADAFKGGTLRRVVVVVSNRGAGINPHWIEYGTTATRVSPKGGLLTFVIDGRLVRKRAVAGVRAQPFMRPANDANWQDAVAVVRGTLVKAIANEAQRLGTRARARRK